MTITQALSLDVARESVVRISAKQFDENSRFLLITVLESGQEQSIPSASTITLNGRRPDGSSQSFLGSVQDGKALVEIDSYLLEQYGTVYCSVSIIGSDGAKLSTLSFRMVVERAESTGWVLMYTAPSALSAGTYHINVGSISYQFTLTQALPVGGSIYFESDYTGAKTVVNGADVETLTLTVGTGGTELIGSDVVNFLTQISQEVASINAGLDSKADKSAIEENLAAGTSLATIDKDSYTPSTSPYLYRQSPNGKRCEMDIIGGTVGWNQIFQTRATPLSIGVVVTPNADRSGFTAVGTTSSTAYCLLNTMPKTIINHIYYVNKGVESNDYQLYNDNGGVNTGFNLEAIGKATAANNFYLWFRGGVTYNFSATPQVIDLTTLLGSTIADYAYTLESNTSGSGIAWLKSFGFLTKSYYSYTEPTLESVEATARQAVGINLFDKSQNMTANKHLTSTGEENVNNDWSYSDYIAIIPNTEYYATVTGTNPSTCFYDSNKNFISGIKNSETVNHRFTTPSNAFYLRTSIQTSLIDSFILNISNSSINGTYYPYESHTYPLGTLTLRGIPKLDANNNIYYDGDKYGADGTVTRRYGVVDLGTLNYTKYNVSNGNAFVASIPTAKPFPNSYITNIICATYPEDTSQNNAYYIADKTCKFGGSYFGTSRLTIVDSAYSTAEAFKTAMSGVYLVYELATPTTETTDPFTPIQYTGSTEAFTTSNDVPVGIDGKYYDDLALPKLPTANGTYSLKCTVTDGVGIVSWVSD